MKIDYLVLNAKLLLINMTHIDFFFLFFFKRKFIDKKFDKTTYTY